jgi:hypothetical protein
MADTYREESPGRPFDAPSVRRLIACVERDLRRRRRVCLGRLKARWASAADTERETRETQRLLDELREIADPDPGPVGTDRFDPADGCPWA